MGALCFGLRAPGHHTLRGLWGLCAPAPLALALRGRVAGSVGRAAPPPPPAELPKAATPSFLWLFCFSGWNTMTLCRGGPEGTEPKAAWGGWLFRRLCPALPQEARFPGPPHPPGAQRGPPPGSGREQAMEQEAKERMWPGRAGGGRTGSPELWPAGRARATPGPVAVQPRAPVRVGGRGGVCCCQACPLLLPPRPGSQVQASSAR